ncbi:unnamed protein product, partial [Symbiodinium necroappetens]
MISTVITIKRTTHPLTPLSSSSKGSVCCSPDATSAVVVASSPVSRLLLPSAAGEEWDVVVCEVEKVLCEELDDVEENVMLFEVEELLDVRVNVEEEVSTNDVEENVMLLEVEEMLDVRVNVEEDVSVELLVVAELETLL